MGRLACPDYTNFKIEDGRLLLFELTGFTNGRTVWNSDPAGFPSTRRYQCSQVTERPLMRRWLSAVLLLGLAVPGHAELLLGAHAEEPAPSVAALYDGVEIDDQLIHTRPYDDVSALLAALQGGQIQLAILEEPAAALAGVNLIADLYPSVLHILYREPAAPESLGEVLGLGGIWAGPPGGIGHRLAGTLAENFGVRQQQRLLPDPWSETPEVFFIFGGLLAPDALSRLPGYRLYSLGDPAMLMHGSVAEGVSLRYPNLRPFVLPAHCIPPSAQNRHSPSRYPACWWPGPT